MSDPNLPVIIAQWVADEYNYLDAALRKAGNPDPLIFIETVAINVFKERYTVEEITLAIDDYKVTQYIELLFWRPGDKDKIH